MKKHPVLTRTSPLILYNLAVGALSLTALLVGSNRGWAASSPAACSANNLLINIARDKPTIVNGDTVTFSVTIDNPDSPDSCDITLGPQGLVFHCPGPDGTPSGPTTTLIPEGFVLYGGGVGFGPIVLTIPCVINLDPGVTVAQVRVESPGALFHDNPLQDDPAYVHRTFLATTVSPSGCSANNLIINIAKNGSNIRNGDTVSFSVVIDNPDTPDTCDITLGPQGLVFHSPGPDGTPSGAVTTLIPGGTVLPGGDASFGPMVLTIPCPIRLNPGTRVAQARVETDDITRTISLNAFDPCIELIEECDYSGQAQCFAPGTPIQVRGVVHNCGDVLLENVKVIDDESGVLLSLLTLMPDDGAPGGPDEAAYVRSYHTVTSCGDVTSTVRASGLAPLDDPVIVTQENNTTCTVCCPALATPTISPNGGSHVASVPVTLECPTAGAEIRYTLDGTDPTPSSPLYVGPFTLTTLATVKAKAFKIGSKDSLVASTSFLVTPPVQCTTRPSTFWFSHVVAPPGVQLPAGESCTTLQAVFDQLPGGLMDLGFLQVNLNQALGLFWGTQAGPGTGERDALCVWRKRLASELIAALANVTLLNIDTSSCGVTDPNTGQFIVIGTLIEPARALLSGQPGTTDCTNKAAWMNDMSELTALLYNFNLGGTALPLPPNLLGCGVGLANALYIQNGEVDSTTLANCGCP